MLTVHRSKGLEFPVVYCPVPVGAVPGSRRAARPVTFHDPSGRPRTIDVGLEGRAVRRATRAAPRRAARRGAAAGLRRADARQAPGGGLVGRHRTTAATRRSGGCCSRATTAGNGPRRGTGTPTDDAARDALRRARRRGAGLLSVASVALGRAAPWVGEPAPAADLTAAAFDRTLDARWRRMSYSAITAGAYEARVASEPEEPVADDEPDAASRPPPRPRRRTRLRAVPSLLPACPRARASARSCTRSSRRPTSPPPDLTPSWPRASPTRARGGRSTSATPTRWSPGCGARSRRRSDRCGGVRLRDLARADRLDELTSSCRWSAATTRRRR